MGEEETREDAKSDSNGTFDEEDEWPSFVAAGMNPRKASREQATKGS